MMPSEQKPPEQMPEDQLLQDILQQLEAGASIEERLADLSKEEADLVKLVASLREMPFPERDAKRAAAQRTQYLRQMVRASQMSTHASR